MGSWTGKGSMDGVGGIVIRAQILLLLGLGTAVLPARAQEEVVVELMATVWDDGPGVALARYDSLSDDRRDPAILVRLADQLLWTGKDREATEILARAETEAPWLAELRFHQGRAYLHRGQRAAALSVFREGLEVVDTDSTLSQGERESLQTRLRDRIGLLDRAAGLLERAGAYRTADGGLLSFKFDPYLHTFPSLLELSTGRVRILHPAEPTGLEWRSQGGRPLGSVVFEDDSGGQPVMVLRSSDGVQRATRIEILRETVRFSPTEDVTIEGTLFRPRSGESVPGVVLAHGAGLSTRYNLVHEAVSFAAAGIAAFVYDKPGLGASTGGNWLLLSIREQATYLAAAVDRLREGSNVGHVGVWGFSQGGWVAPLAARQAETVDFVVLASAAAVTPQEQSIQASVERLESEGFSDREIDDAVANLRELWSRINAGRDLHALADLRATASAAAWGGYVQQPRIGFEVTWWRENEVDARGALESLAVPVLAIYGERDTVVPPDENVPLLTEYLEAAPTGDYSIAVLPGADHRMMVGDDYQPLYFETATTWVTSRFGPTAIGPKR